MTAIKFELKGSKELNKALSQLETRAHQKVATAASAAGARRYRKELQKVLPRSSQKQPGYIGSKLKKDVRLLRSIGIRKAGTGLYQVGVAGPARAYAHIIEFGSKHVAPRPFWRKTFDAQWKVIIEDMGKRAWTEIAKVGRR
jgi:HK97 gp10 family phage protein